MARGAELETCFDLRRRVFVTEQGIDLDLEFDGSDDGQVVHLLARAEERPAGTARLRIVAGEPAGPYAKAERVAVLAEYRRAGIGRALMDALEAEARRRGLATVVLHAQESAVAFYSALGYHEFGEPFSEAGIPHRRMRKALG